MGQDRWWEPRRDGEETAAYLARVLDELGRGFEPMAKRARAYHYDDFRSELAMPINALLLDLHSWAQPATSDQRQRAMAVADAAKRGEFDSTRGEYEAWAAGPEGRAFRERLGGV